MDFPLKLLMKRTTKEESSSEEEVGGGEGGVRNDHLLRTSQEHGSVDSTLSPNQSSIKPTNYRQQVLPPPSSTSLLSLVGSSSFPAALLPSSSSSPLRFGDLIGATAGGVGVGSTVQQQEQWSNYQNDFDDNVLKFFSDDSHFL